MSTDQQNYTSVVYDIGARDPRECANTPGAWPNLVERSDNMSISPSSRGDHTPFGWLPAPDPRDTCPERHAVKNRDTGTWQRGTDDALGYIIQGNGILSYRLTCRTCGTRSSSVPKTVAEHLVRNGTPIEWTQVNQPRSKPGCAVTGCTDPGVDNHHFAPRNTFGAEAEAWPVLPLCRRHHVEWHQRMDGYRWHARRTA